MVYFEHITEDHNYESIGPGLEIFDIDLIKDVERLVKTDYGMISRNKMSRIYFLANDPEKARAVYDNKEIDYYYCGNINVQDQKLLIGLIEKIYQLRSVAA